ncbi:hypothetical protein [Parvimonas micra]
MRKSSNKVIEVSNLEANELVIAFGEKKFCKSLVYGEKVGGRYVFCDLRTKFDTSKIGLSNDIDFAINKISFIERTYRYYNANLKKFDLDYCKSIRKKYSFKIMEDLYSVLWDNKLEKIDSAETLISFKQNVVKIFLELRKKQRGRPTVDWDIFCNKNDCELDKFSYSVATIGNFMPVPSCEQRILNNFTERFDILLLEIKKYYKDNKHHKYFSPEFKEWLNLFVDKNNEISWEEFVKSNYLMGSFVDEFFNIICFDGTADQLSEIIYNRSVVMIEEYEKRISKITEK